MKLRCLSLMLAATALTGVENVNPDANMPPALRGVGIEQKLNSPAPLDLEFIDESGARKPLRAFMNGRPAVLAFVYYECPMLCTMELNGLLRALRAMPLTAGQEFDILTVSFNPKDTPAKAAAKKAEYLEKYRRPGAERGWHFLTGSEENIQRLTKAAGFQYQLDPNSGQWAHASGIMVLTPEGRLARYFYGIEYSARDLRLGLVEAGKGRIGNTVDQILLFCYHYDPATGKYGMVVMNLIRAGGVATILALCVFWWLMSRRGRNGKYQNVDRLPVIS